MKNNKLTHFDKDGNPSMVDINSKDMTVRVAIAFGKITMQPETLKKILDIKIKKGDVLTIAKIAGIMAAKKTEQLIPLCHSIPLSYVNVDLQPDIKNSCINIKAEASLVGKTGVEMEALTAVSIASLTIYDMCKSIDREMVITNVKLLHKSGGKSGEFNAAI
ncbi:MAG: cyclic pyranopterin monophosphate synthase MoaC [Candidatus Puniceispirillales bacterium]|nr:cyclic pyranopterin monophosphate synthase MoaC [Alphaproteobacteria bacterium]